MTSKIRILVAEDHLIARVGVIAIINMQNDMMVVAEAVNGQQALDLFRKHLPDVTLLDMRMPMMSGVDSAVAIRAEYPSARIIALTTYGGEGDIRRALSAGMQAYLTKDVLHEELLKTIRAVHAGQCYLPKLAAQLPMMQLSAREIQVLQLIVSGLANKQIAHTLKIADATAKNHVQHILNKLGVQDRTQAATAAIQRGIIAL